VPLITAKDEMVMPQSLLNPNADGDHANAATLSETSNVRNRRRSHTDNALSTRRPF
jgi:hypothetical protein